ncbi:Spc98 family-domain-containing protein [Chytridium lagenaria]|nr:Spc98 family-domain-containing protein [Chytridium lagenaria]
MDKTFSYITKVTEAMLLRDMIFYALPIPLRSLLYQLAEVGWLYRKIDVFIKEQKEKRPSGLVIQSFCSGVEEELSQYYQYIASLENFAATKSNETFISEGLSLKRLLVWMLDSLQKLRILVVLVDLCKGFTTRPFFNLLSRWIFDGELEDPFNEFFVLCDRTAEPPYLWRNQYLLADEHIPSFIRRETAKKAFLIGKSLNFLRFECNHQAYVISRSKEAHEAKLINVYYKKTSHRGLESAIRSSNAANFNSDIVRRLDVRLLEVLMRQYLRIFIYLWRLKRLEFGLSSSMEASPRLSLLEFNRVLQLCQPIWSEMNHFIFQLQYYILFELIGAHNKYLNQIVAKALFTNGSNQVFADSRKLSYVGVCLFLLQNEIFVLKAETYGTARTVQGSDIRSRGMINPSERLLKIRESLTEVSSSFRDHLRQLLELFHNHSDPHLHGLRFRLDFNDVRTVLPN